MIKFALRNIINKLIGQDIWRIGLIESPAEAIIKEGIDKSKVKWLTISNKDYEADPFLFRIHDKFYIAYEVFDYLHGNGKIKCVDLEGFEHDFFSEINKVRGHKSFPFVFEEEGILYCIPETSDLEKITLYIFDSRKSKFVEHSILLSGDRYVDTCVKKIEGKYYLFTSTSTAPFKQRLFVSSMLASEYQEHPSSPIASDPEHGRNAGGIMENELGLFRVSQDCKTGYGSKLNVMLIKKINEVQYREVLFRSIEPVKIEHTGIHTITTWDDMTVIDAKTTVKKISNFPRKLIYKLMLKTRMEIKYR